MLTGAKFGNKKWRCCPGTEAALRGMNTMPREITLKMEIFVSLFKSGYSQRKEFALNCSQWEQILFFKNCPSFEMFQILGRQLPIWKKLPPFAKNTSKNFQVYQYILTFTTPWANSADNKPLEKICMKCHT